MARVCLVLCAACLLAGGVHGQQSALVEKVTPEGAPAFVPRYRFGSTWFQHGDKAFAVAFTPNGKTLVSGHGDNTIRFWDVESGTEVRRLQGHTQFVRSLAIAPDGQTLASASGDRTVRLWDMRTGKQLHQLSEHTGWAFCVAFSPDGKLVASGGEGGNLLVWETVNGKLVWQAKEHTGLIMDLAFHPSGKELVTVSHDHRACIWDTLTGQMLREIKGHPHEIGAVTFSPDGKKLATGSSDGIVRLWDASTGGELEQFPITDRWILSLAFSRDGRLLAVGGQGKKTSSVLDLASGKEKIDVDTGPAAGVHPDVIHVCFSPDDQWVVFAGEDAVLRVRESATGRPAGRTQGHHTGIVSQVALSADGKLLAWAGPEDDRIRLADLSTGKELPPLEGHAGGVVSLAFVAGESTLISGGRHGEIRVWDPGSIQPIRSLHSQQAELRVLAISPDGKWCALAGRDRQVLLWDLPAGRELARLNAPEGPVDQLCFSSDGKILFGISALHRVLRWDLVSFRELPPLNYLQGGATCLALAGNGRFLATGGLDHVIHLWDVTTGRELHRLAGNGGIVTCLAFAPDGRTLVSTNQKDVFLWDVYTGKSRGRLSIHAGTVLALAVAPNGRGIVSGSTDCTAAFWDLVGLREKGADLARDWSSLESEDAGRAYRANWSFVAEPDQAVSFLQSHVHALPRIEPHRLRELVDDLDSDAFPTRQKAAQELANLGEVAETVLREVLRGEPSPEVRRRSEELLERLGPVPVGDRLRQLRAIEVLECIGTPAARALLERIAAGAPEVRLTQEAKQSLERLSAHRP